MRADHTPILVPSGRLLDRQEVAGVAIAALVVVGALAVFSLDEPPEPYTAAIVALDVSVSSAAKTRCEDLLSIVEGLRNALDQPLRVTLLASGDRSTGFEPTRIGVVRLGRTARLLEQQARARAAESALRDEVSRLCASVPTRSVSPVFATLSTAVAYLREVPCHEEHVSCDVWLRTDGIETSDEVVRQALMGRVRRDRRARIDNEHISVHVCGLSERRTSARTARRLPTLTAVETALRGEFTHPELIHMSATCAPVAR